MLIAQISDLHLRPPGVLYQDVADSNAMFAAAIRHVNGLDPRPDLVILTGDVVDTGTSAEYQTARELLAELRIPMVAIPGNHDDREGFRAAFAEQEAMPAEGPIHFAIEDRGPVRIVALDVTVPGHHHGLIEEGAIRWLEQVLVQAPDRPTIIMMHQPPLTSHVPYLDDYRCLEGERLAALVRQHPNVERIVCGHVHRFMLARFAGTVLCTAPSTATAIALGLRPDAEPLSYLEPPGLLLHHWSRDTGLVTHAVPIGCFPGPFHFA